MLLSEFDYFLPPDLIAQTPIEPRDHSRLLHLQKNSGNITHRHFYDIADLLWENDVLVVNKTRVINARLKGKIDWIEKECEVFLHKQISENTWDCLVYPWKKMKIWTTIMVPVPNLIEVPVPELIWIVKEISDHGRIIEFNLSWIDFLKTIEKIGETPLPPYIKEKVQNPERYQTTYNEKEWSVAAPTAGLHFTPELLKKLEDKWVKIEKVLLHVGIGTFKNVETENILNHTMHSEYCEIEEDVSKRLNQYKKDWKRIIAVGTTSVRTLESMSVGTGTLEYGSKETNIFIYPGYKWKFVDSIITNFHLPKSTLVMLVSSFAWKETIKKAYEEAIKEKYRFFSFWDAMWIE